MRNFLALLADFAWVLYAACGLGAIIYVVRAIALQRRRTLSLTSFERETTAEHIAQLWRLALVFSLVGVALYAAQAYLLPRLPLDELAPPEETAVGLIMPTPTPPPTQTPIFGAMPTLTTTVASPLAPDAPTVAPTEVVVVEPTPAQEQMPAIALNARFGTAAELMGYDVTAVDVTAAGGVGVILYWRALEGATAANYTVFAYLRTPDGQIIAQHEGTPVNGARPTTGWLVGEQIVDYHQMVFNEAGAAYTGPAEVLVGFFDAAAPANRLPVEGGGDFVILPSPINVVAP